MPGREIFLRRRFCCTPDDAFARMQPLLICPPELSYAHLTRRSEGAYGLMHEAIWLGAPTQCLYDVDGLRRRILPRRNNGAAACPPAAADFITHAARYTTPIVTNAVPPSMPVTPLPHRFIEHIYTSIPSPMRCRWRDSARYRSTYLLNEPGREPRC